MALPATDNFNRTNQNLDASANWTSNTGNLIISSNTVAPEEPFNFSVAHWVSDAFDNDQYSQGVIAASGSSNPIGTAVRCATSANTFYYFFSDGDDSYLGKNVNGSNTEWSSGAGFSVGNEIKLEVEGTTLTAYKNDSTTGMPGPQTDSSITSGSAGLSGFGDNVTNRIDDWEGGNLGAGSPVTVEAAVGVVSVSGQQATVVAPIVIEAGTGVVSVSGQSVTVIAPIVTSAAAGTVTVNGIQATIDASTTIAAGPGVVSVSGQTATVIAPNVTAASVGVVNITGQTATIDAPTTIAAAVGVVSVTGQTATVVAPIVTTASVGVIQVSGQQATITSAVVVSAAAGVVSISGPQATVSASTTITASVGVVSVSGQAATIVAPIVTTASAAVVSISGQTATIDVGAAVTVAAVVGIVSVSGQTAALVVPTLAQSAYRWRNDDGSEITATWRQVQDTPDSISVGVPLRLRVQVDASEDPDPAQFRLEYRKVTEPEGAWLPVEVEA